MARAPGLEKKPNSYDEYQTTLKPKHQEMAREELHEDDFSREPALAQMREFIAKHPQIQRCRTDAVFLLRFLRSVKFNVIAACNRLENFLVATELHAEFFKKFDESDMNDLVGSCVFVPVEKDPDDRLVIFFRAGQFDPKIFTPERQCQLGTILLETYLDIEMYHITGLVLVFDLRNTTMAHYGIWNLPKLKILMTAINELVACRIKEIHVVQIPKFAAMVADFCVAALKPKLRQRLKFHKSLEDFKDCIDEAILPTIYGGKVSLEEANDRFLERALQERDRILMLSEMFIDLSIPNPNSKNSNSGLHSGVGDESVIGSFRKLNVD